jgi:hypothetical protein
LRIGYFGSYARGEATAESDVDIVFDTDAPNLLRAACGNRTLSVELPGFAEASAGEREKRGFRQRFRRVLQSELAAAGDDPRQDRELKEILRRIGAGP